MSERGPGKALLSVQNIVRSYGGQPVLQDISLTLHEGDRIGLIGRNGCGKSTLMRILAGADDPDDGLVTRAQGLRVALLTQQCEMDTGRTVDETLQEAAGHLRSLLDQYHRSIDRLAETPGDCWEHREIQEECDALQHALDAHDGWHWEQELKRVAVALDLPPGGRRLATLSGGELRRVDLASKLLQAPDVLLLDEPTNHIDTRSVEWMERFLANYRGSCVLVTHDRYFLDRVVNRIVELEFNRLHVFPGNYERFLDYRATVDETTARTEANRRGLIRRELAWLRRGPKARATKQKARIKRAYGAMDQSGPEQHRRFVYEIPEPQPLGKTILEARGITHGYGDSPLFQNLSLLMQRDMRIGIVGPNGSGKTTLLRVLMGQERPKRGQVVIGDTVAFLYIDQTHEEIDPHQTVLKFVSDGAHHLDVNRKRIHVPSYLDTFLFDRAAVDTPIGRLSGGEQNRLDLVKKLLLGGNFLVLDEPTNDLDLYSLRVLEETIDAFQGCALIVSHDRYFLNRVCTHMLVFEDSGEVVCITGNYEDYLLYRDRREAEQPKKEAVTPKAAAKDRASGPKKLTYLEEKEFEGMETTLLEAEAEVARLEAAIQAEGFYDQDHAVVKQGLDALEAAWAEVDRLYARWADLEARVSG